VSVEHEMRIEKTDKITPGHPSDLRTGEWSVRNKEIFDWGAVGARAMHPAKVAILEALHWICRPLSASQLEKVLDGVYSLGVISHHLKCLADWDALEVVERRQVRGAMEKSFFFAGEVSAISQKDDDG
jgi:hypothetical protein